MIPLPTRVNMESKGSLFDSNGQPNDVEFQKSVDQMTDELLWYMEVLIEKRSISGTPKILNNECITKIN